MNLTAIRDPEDIVRRHFGESLFAARYLFPRCSSVPALSEAEESPASSVVKSLSSASPVSSVVKSAAVADVGSGAGFPGIPLKLWAPQISLTLIESNQKKATFLREVARVLTLTDINIQTARAETLAEPRFDVVTLRAVEDFATILPIAAGLLAPAGRLALLIGAGQCDSARTSLPHLSWDPPIPIPHSRSRILLTARLK